MQKNKGSVAVTLVAFSAGLLLGLSRQPLPVGVSAGPFHTEDEEFAGTTFFRSLVHGDRDAALPSIRITVATSNSAVLTLAQICENSLLNIANQTPSASGSIRVASATSLFGPGTCLDEVGDTKEFTILNAVLDPP